MDYTYHEFHSLDSDDKARSLIYVFDNQVLESTWSTYLAVNYFSIYAKKLTLVFQCLSFVLFTFEEIGAKTCTVKKPILKENFNKPWWEVFYRILSLLGYFMNV